MRFDTETAITVQIVNKKCVASCLFQLMVSLYYLYLILCFCTFNLGERTFGVLTKIDLMDKGTDAVDVS